MKETYWQPKFPTIVVAISAIAFLATGTTIGLLYRTSILERTRDLERAANTLAALMESVSQFDRKHSDATHPEGSRGATLSQIAQAQLLLDADDSGADMEIAHRKGDHVEILRPSPEGEFVVVSDWESESKFPAALAVRGQSGSGKFPDHDGTPVLAAYAPVPTLQIGIAYQMDMATLRAPFLRAGGWAAAVYGLMVGLLAAGHRLVTHRLAHRLRSSEQRFAAAFESAPVVMIVLSSEGMIEQVNPTFEQLTGWRQDEIRGREWFDTFLPERDRDRIRTLFRTATHGTPTRGNVNPILTRTGQEREIEWYDQVLCDAGGILSGLLSVGIDVTERRKGEERLRQSEEQFRLSLTAAGQGFYDLDLTTGDAEVSPEYARMIGHDPEDFEETNANWKERLHPDERDHVYTVFEEYIRGEIPKYEVEFRQRTESGGWLWTLSIGSIVERDAGGAPLRMLGTHTNIDARKRAEAAQMESERFARAALDALSSHIAVVDEHGCILAVNRAWREFGAANGGVPERCNEGANYLSVCEAAGKEGAEAADCIREVISGRAPEMTFDGACHSSSERRWFFCRIRRFPGDAPIRVAIAHENITQSKEAERLLVSSARKLAKAQRIARVGSWELDLIANRLEWSEEVFRLFEMDPAKFEASYEAFIKAIHPEDRETVNRAYTDSLKNRKPYRIVHRLLMPDGRVKHVEEQCETEFNAAGEPLVSRGTVQDVTDRELAEEAIRRSLIEKETLLREIHHRLKNNLQIVSSLLHFQSKKVSDATAVTAFSEARTRLRSMVLVHESLYNSGSLAELHLDEYTRLLVDQLVRSSGDVRQRIRFRMEVQPIMLPIETALPCGMILVELITNIIKYAYPGDQDGEAVVQLEAEDKTVHLRVRDHGVGLPAGFDHQSASTFGWQLIRDLTQQLDGTLEINNQAGLSVTISFIRKESK